MFCMSVLKYGNNFANNCKGPTIIELPGARGQGPGGQGASLSLTQCCFIIFAVGCGLCSSVFPHVVAR